jgi:hypothetical protein
MESEKQGESGLDADPPDDANKEAADDPAGSSETFSPDVQSQKEPTECMPIDGGKIQGEFDVHSEREMPSDETSEHLQQDATDGCIRYDGGKTMCLGVSGRNVDISGQTSRSVLPLEENTAGICPKHPECHGPNDCPETRKQQQQQATSGGEHTEQEQESSESAEFVAETRETQQSQATSGGEHTEQEQESSESAEFAAGVNSIVAMGFELGDAQAAMIQTENNVILAIDLLTGGGHRPIDVAAGPMRLPETSTQDFESSQQGVRHTHVESLFEEEEEEAVLVEKDDACLDEASHTSMPSSGRFDAQQQGGVASLTESLRNNFGAISKKIDRLVDDRLATAEKILDQKIKETSIVTTNKFSSFTSGAKTWGGLFSQKMSQAASKSTNFIKEVAKDLDLDHPAPDGPPLHDATCTLATGQGLAPVALAMHGER